MTTTTINPAVVASYSADDIKRQLVAGRTVQQVADRTGWPRQRVTAIINGVHGWMLDPSKDTVYQPDNRHMAPTLPDDVDPAPPRPAPPAGNRTAIEAAAPVPEPDLRPRQPTRLLDAIATILGLLDSNDDPAVAKDVTRARDALAKLRSTLTTSEERRQAEADIETAKAALAAAQEKLRLLKSGKAPAAVTPASPEVTPREIRAWAAEHGIECAPNGKIPASVRQQYDTAHNKEDATR